MIRANRRWNDYCVVMIAAAFMLYPTEAELWRLIKESFFGGPHIR